MVTVSRPVSRRQFRARAWRIVGRRPAPITIELQPATIEVRAVPLGVSTAQPQMPGGLAVDAQVAWLENYVRSLEARHNALSPEVRRQADAQDDAVRAARSYAEKEISKAVDDVRSEVRQLVGQDVGWEIGWLGVVAIGVVLSPFRPTCAPASRTYVWPMSLSAPAPNI
jgi:tetrahydromethanopterin S-methyltransferase subunit G